MGEILSSVFNFPFAVIFYVMQCIFNGHLLLHVAWQADACIFIYWCTQSRIWAQLPIVSFESKLKLKIDFNNQISECQKHSKSIDSWSSHVRDSGLSIKVSIHRHFYAMQCFLIGSWPPIGLFRSKIFASLRETKFDLSFITF